MYASFIYNLHIKYISISNSSLNSHVFWDTPYMNSQEKFNGLCFFGRNQTQPDHHNGVSPILCLFINMISGIISFTVSSQYNFNVSNYLTLH